MSNSSQQNWPHKWYLIAVMREGIMGVVHSTSVRNLTDTDRL